MARFRRQLRRFSSVAGNIFENMWYKVPFLLLLIQHSVSSTGSSSSHKHAPFRIDKICNQANHSSAMPPKPRTTFSPPGGHTQDDQRIDWEHRETLKRSRTERLKPFSGKGDYLEELQKSEGILDVQLMFLSKLAIEENRMKGLSSGNREEYVHGGRLPECSKWQRFKLQPTKEEDLARSTKEVVDAIRTMIGK
jgi:hypothetical protein